MKIGKNISEEISKKKYNIPFKGFDWTISEAESEIHEIGQLKRIIKEASDEEVDNGFHKVHKDGE